MVKKIDEWTEEQRWTVGGILLGCTVGGILLTMLFCAAIIAFGVLTNWI